MKKLMMMAVATLLVTGAAFAGDKKCHKGDKCCKKEAKTASKEKKDDKAKTTATTTATPVKS